MSTKSHFVSIIIPVYNRAETIAETLESILAQTHTDWECILVDDGSTDNSLQVVAHFTKKDSRIQLFERPTEKPKGANSCRNIGFEKSKGNFILFLDSDDFLNSNSLENRQKIFNQREKMDFVSAETAYYNGGNYSKTAICHFPEQTTTKMYLEHFLSYKIPWPIMGVLWKRSTIEAIKFDEDLQRLQDVDFHIRVLLQANLIGFRLNEIDNYYRSEKSKLKSKSQNKNVVQSASKLIEKYLKSDLLNEEQLITFRQFILFFSFNYFYPNQKEFKREVCEVESIIKKANVFNKKELRLLNFYKNLEYYNLTKTKGIGVNRLTKSIKNALRYK